MKIIGLDNKEYAWNIVRYNSKSDNCSNLHLRARKLLTKLFPYEIIYEELSLPGIKVEINNKSLSADFYIHFYRLMVEVQGEQHYKFVKFFHNNKLEFLRARKLDDLKRRWCKINNIKLIELPFNETDIEWEQRIRNVQ